MIWCAEKQLLCNSHVFWMRINAIVCLMCPWRDEKYTRYGVSVRPKLSPLEGPSTWRSRVCHITQTWIMMCCYSFRREHEWKNPWYQTSSHVFFLHKQKTMPPPYAASFPSSWFQQRNRPLDQEVGPHPSPVSTNICGLRPRLSLCCPSHIPVPLIITKTRWLARNCQTLNVSIPCVIHHDMKRKKHASFQKLATNPHLNLSWRCVEDYHPSLPYPSGIPLLCQAKLRKCTFFGEEKYVQD